jgi:hypothetical protein
MQKVSLHQTIILIVKVLTSVKNITLVYIKINFDRKFERKN